ncbi:MAG TPA: PEP-CTERM sorting domain-containing protein [Verrucomicrobiae bacterium]
MIAGDYTVCLQAYNADQGNVSIWQTGTLPANAVSLEFRAWNYPSANGDFSVSFANNNLSPVAIGSGQSSTGQDYTDYSANIQPYAGQTGALEFTAIGGNGANWLELDDINFSSTTPEPGTAVLTCLGGMVFWMYRRFRRN